MRAFHFPLEKVLELRAYKEDEARRELAARVGKCLQLETSIRDRQTQRARTMLEHSGNTDLLDWMAAERYAARLLHEEERLKREWEAAESAREKSAEVFRKAMAERKALESVKEKRYDRHRRSEKIRDIKAMDDMTASRRRH